jgi:hypothetical protein
LFVAAVVAVPGAAVAAVAAVSGLRRLLRTLGIVPHVLSPTKSAVVTVGGSLLVYPDNQTNSVSAAFAKVTH